MPNSQGSQTHHLRTLTISAFVIGTYFSACTFSWAQTTAPWPDLKLPQSLQLFSVGEHVVMNGKPMRMHGFISKQTPDQLSRSVQETLGQPLVINNLGRQIILGRAQGLHYISVQIEPASNGSRGIVSITDLRAALLNSDTTMQERQRWLQQLPAGTRLSSHMKSLDDLKQSQQLIYRNRFDENLNRDRLKTILQADGLAFEHEAMSDDGPSKAARTTSQGRLLFFKGSGKEAMATMHRQPDGQTVTVLNIINTMEKYK